MKDHNFKAFIDILRILKKKHIENSSIRETVIDLIGKYEKDLTKDQKSAILGELLEYEKKQTRRKAGKLVAQPSRDYF